MKSLNIPIWIFIFAYLVLKPGLTYAGFTFTIPKTSVTEDDTIEATINLSLKGQNNKIYYLEGAFKNDTSSNYFGLTWNDASWVQYTASGFTSLKSITTDQSGNWSGILNVKLDKNSTLFKGAGNYTLRLKRFTQSGSPTWTDNEFIITVSNPSPTPTASPSPNPTTQPTPTPTPNAANPSQTPTSTTKPSVFTTSNTPSSINSDQSLITSINISSPDDPNTKFYLKGAFKKQGGSNYFGLTKVSDNWIQNGASFTEQFPITTDSSGNWKGDVEIKIDTTDSGYSGSGDYIFKAGKYKSTDTNPSVSWSGESNIYITNITEGTNDQTYIPTYSKESLVKLPSPTPVSSTKTSNPPQTTRMNNVQKINNASVAGVTSDSATPSSTESASINKSPAKTPLIFIGATLTVSGFASVLFIYLRSKSIL